MSGYGNPPGGSTPSRGAWTAILAAAVLLLGGCAIPDADPDPIVIPTAAQLSTETAPESVESDAQTSPTSRQTRRPVAEDSLGHALAVAPRADNSRYRQAAESLDAPLEDTSSFHFTTPDRRASCSVFDPTQTDTATSDNGGTTLGCRLAEPAANMPVPPDTPPECDWRVDYVTLSNSGPKYGACDANVSILYRSTLIDFGTAITVGRFSCLADVEGLFCLHAGSDVGFSVTDAGYAEISATDVAPPGLLEQ